MKVSLPSGALLQVSACLGRSPSFQPPLHPDCSLPASPSPEHQAWLTSLPLQSAGFVWCLLPGYRQ